MATSVKTKVPCLYKKTDVSIEVCQSCTIEECYVKYYPLAVPKRAYKKSYSKETIPTLLFYMITKQFSRGELYELYRIFGLKNYDITADPKILQRVLFYYLYFDVVTTGDISQASPLNTLQDKWKDFISKSFNKIKDQLTCDGVCDRCSQVQFISCIFEHNNSF